jgi:glycosyltransferase involved in cell wall biosynthesis
MPKISVIMPIYNAENYVKASIDSILTQTFTDFELILVNDCSTDRSGEVIRAIDDPRIRIIENEKNSGIIISRNKAIDIAQGKYLAIIDSDDIAFPDRLKDQFRFMEEHPECGICGSDYTVIDSNEKLVATMIVPRGAKENRTYLKLNICFCNSTMMIRTEATKSIRYRPGYDIIGDYEIAYQVSKTWTIDNIPVITTAYRVHGNNISIVKRRAMLDNRRELDEEVLRDLGVPFTEHELDLHSNYINSNDEFFDTREKRKELASWLGKYIHEISRRKDLEPNVLKRVFALRWILMCLKRKAYSELFNPGILSATGASYFACAKDLYQLKFTKKFMTY